MFKAIKNRPSNKLSNTLYYALCHKNELSENDIPLPNKHIGYRDYKPKNCINDYRKLLGKVQHGDWRSSHNFLIYQDLTPQDVTYISLKIDVLECYTFAENNFDIRNISLSLGKLFDAILIFNGLDTKLRKTSIKKDPLYKMIYLTDAQRELYRAKNYMPKDIATDEYAKLITEAIIDPSKLENQQLLNWHFSLLNSWYSLRFN